MGWFFLEVLIALVIAVGIVWWTMGPRTKKPPSTGANDRDGTMR
jgi:hypothetical protein